MAAAAHVAEVALRPAEQRGSLTVADRVFEKIAVAVARDSGSVYQSVTFGRDLPKAKAERVGDRVRLDLEVAAGWGAPLSQVARGLRYAVGSQVQQQTGFVVDSVDVKVSRVLPPESPGLLLAPAPAVAPAGAPDEHSSDDTPSDTYGDTYDHSSDPTRIEEARHGDG